MIPFGNLKKHYVSIKQDIDETIFRVLNRGWFILGEEVEKFEKEFSNFCGKKYGVGVGNGTDALILALKALNIGEGDEVITVPNTAIPTVSAIISTGAKPRFVDIGEDYLIDVKKIEKAINENTKAIIPVHLFGQACDMDPIIKISERYNLAIIEDCCQAHGAEYKGKRVPISDIGCFSFYPSKNLGGFGDGGMILTDYESLYNKLKMMRNYGQSDKYHAESQGQNTRLDELQAAILRTKLRYLNGWNEKRRKYASLYSSLLKDTKIDTPIENKGKNHIYHLYVIRSKERDKLQEYLKSKGIGTAIHYPIPLHLQKAYKYLGYKEGDFPLSEKYQKEILSLPIYPELTEEEIKEVIKTVKDFS